MKSMDRMYKLGLDRLVMTSDTYPTVLVVHENSIEGAVEYDTLSDFEAVHGPVRALALVEENETEDLDEIAPQLDMLAGLAAKRRAGEASS